MGVAWLRTGSLAILTAALAGCGTTSVVNSTSVESDDGTPPAKAGTSYGTYFLPQTVISVKLTAKGGGGGGDDKAGASATATSTATVANTITIDGKDAKTEDKGGGGGDAPKPKPMALCDQAMARYNFLQAKHGDYTIKRVEKLDELIQFAYGPLDKAEDKAAAEKALKAFIDAASEDDDRVQAAKPLAAYVPKVCTFPVAVELTPGIQAALDQAYRLRLYDDSLSADSLTAKLDGQNLLTSISTTADDKSADVANGAFKSIGTIVGATYSVSITGAPQSMSLQRSALAARSNGNLGDGNLMALARGRHEVLPKLRTGDLKAVLRETVQIAANAKVAELPLLAPPLPDYALRLSIKDLAPEGGTARVSKLAETGYFLRVTCSALPTFEPPPKDAATPVLTGVLMSSPRACVGQVGTAGFSTVSGKIERNDLGPNGWNPVLPERSPPTSAQLASRAALDKSFDDAQSWSLSVLDSRRPLHAELLRTRMVKRTHGYEFKDGQLTQATYEKPSDAAAIVALPGNLVGSLLSGISAGLQGRQGTYKDQAALLDARASVYNSQAALIKAKAAAEAAKHPKDDTPTDDTSGAP
jgi:hypothetical protein